MFFEKIRAKNFRPFSDIEIEFIPGINLLIGPNGIGKTSIIEAIYCLTLTKSFRTNQDRNLIKFNEEFFELTAKLHQKNSISSEIRIFYSVNQGKNLFIDQKQVSRFSEFIGYIPSTILTLDDLDLTFGGPAKRRRFLDILLSQVSQVYLQELRTYKRTVQQKNKLLNSVDKKQIIKQISAWNLKQAESGAHIISKRKFFAQFLDKNISDFYNKFSESNNVFSVEYKSSVNKNINEIEKIKSELYGQLEEKTDEEIQIQKCILGPHRDDLDFKKNGKSLKHFASQGENKTFVIALKLLEKKYLQSEKANNSVLLLDDIFGELDDRRIDALVGYLAGIPHVTWLATTLIGCILGDAYIQSWARSRLNIAQNKKNTYGGNMIS